jgi:ribosomal protein L11 methyltransferase
MVDNARALPGHLARLTTDRATAQRLADYLSEHLDGQEVAVASFEAGDGRWSTAAYFSSPPNEAALRALVGLEVGADLAPVAAGRFLVHGRHDRALVRSNSLGIEIEAALAFGTGHHGTTRGCLLALDFIARQKRRPRKILDVGTGSGVLAIAAARALRRRVMASDIDGRALQVARANARLNKTAPDVTFIHAAGLAGGRFRRAGPHDLVLANILLGPLLRLARPMRRLLAPGAYVVLSGLLNSQAQTALMAYRLQGLRLQQRIVLDEWTTLVLRRPALPR